MTDRIDLDEIDVGDGEDEEESNPGDWFWRDDGDAPVERAPDPPDRLGSDGAATDGETERQSTAGEGDPGDPEHDAAGGPVPHVPHSDLGKPAGIPVESGGSGSGAGRSGSAGSDGGGSSPDDGDDSSAAAGPHGGGVDDMTMALTYDAARRLADPARAVADARGWADWIGIVGDVEAFVLNKFQRDEALDLDFFNGSGTGPAERLAAIGPHSMFYAERTVVVGVEGSDESIAEDADWEFVPLSEAASKADWELRDPD